MVSPPDILPAEPEDDPWLTVAEFASATRVQPVTVRSWIAKGQLKATRSGKRKWLIRYSELHRMLYGEWSDNPPPEIERQTAELYADREFDPAKASLRDAGYAWELALERSQMAPPDASFASRLRSIANAAAWQASALRECVDNEPDFAWTPALGTAGMPLSHELRPGGNRPGPRDAWERFDRTVQRLETAKEGDRTSAVAGALSDLAAAARDIAETLELESGSVSRSA